MAENLNLNGQVDEKIREVADRVRGIRLDMNLTEEEMAEKVGISAEEYKKYENGEKDYISSPM